MTTIIELRPELKERLALLLAVPADDKNPFVTDNGKSFMRFDEIRFPFRKVECYWRGVLVATLSPPPMLSGDELRLSGFEGRMGMEIV